MSAYEDMLNSLVSGDDDEDVSGDMSGAVGIDEIIGIDEIVGALRRGGRGSTLSKLAKLKAAGGVGVRSQVRDKMRVQPSPWVPLAILASATSTVTVQPQRLIQILSLMVPSALQTLFDIDDIRVGQQTQFITTGRVPAACFSEVANGDRSKVKFDSADVGNTVAIDFVNLDAVNTQTIRGTLFAVAVY
jgi:hypothetical protein